MQRACDLRRHASLRTVSRTAFAMAQRCASLFEVAAFDDFFIELRFLCFRHAFQILFLDGPDLQRKRLQVDEALGVALVVDFVRTEGGEFFVIQGIW